MSFVLNGWLFKVASHDFNWKRITSSLLCERQADASETRLRIVFHFSCGWENFRALCSLCDFIFLQKFIVSEIISNSDERTLCVCGFSGGWQADPQSRVFMTIFHDVC